MFQVEYWLMSLEMERQMYARWADRQPVVPDRKTETMRYSSRQTLASRGGEI
jgi:hypothetical protein